MMDGYHYPIPPTAILPNFDNTLKHDDPGTMAICQSVAN